MSDATTDQAKQPTHDLMGYEGQIEQTEATAPETELPNAPEDVQSLINKTVKEVTVDDNGKYVYPENIDPVLKAAVAATKSYRDNQSGFTKSQQSLKEAEAEVTALREKLASHTSKSLELSRADQQELEDLKQTDPDAWRAKLNNLEQDSRKAIQDELTEATDEARQKASGEFELDRRYKYLDEFNGNRKVAITPEMMDNDIPPRVTKKLADGEITFEEYLVEVASYIDAGQAVSQPGDSATTDLNKANGSTTPPEGGKEEEGEVDYSNMTF